MKKRASVIEPPYDFQDESYEDSFEMLENIINSNESDMNTDQLLQLLKNQKNSNRNSDSISLSSFLKERKYSDDMSSIDPRLINENDNLSIPENFNQHSPSPTMFESSFDPYSIQYDKQFQELESSTPLEKTFKDLIFSEGLIHYDSENSNLDHNSLKTESQQFNGDSSMDSHTHKANGNVKNTSFDSHSKQSSPDSHKNNKLDSFDSHKARSRKNSKGECSVSRNNSFKTDINSKARSCPNSRGKLSPIKLEPINTKYSKVDVKTDMVRSKTDLSKSNVYKSDESKYSYNESGTNKSNMNKSNTNKSNSNKSGTNKSDFNKSHTNISDLNKSNTNRSEFNSLNLNKSGFNNSNFNKSDFTSSNFNKSDFHSSNFNKSDLSLKKSDSNLNKSDFNNSNFNKSDSNSSNIHKSNSSKSDSLKKSSKPILIQSRSLIDNIDLIEEEFQVDEFISSFDEIESYARSITKSLESPSMKPTKIPITQSQKMTSSYNSSLANQSLSAKKNLRSLKQSISLMDPVANPKSLKSSEDVENYFREQEQRTPGKSAKQVKN